MRAHSIEARIVLWMLLVGTAVALPTLWVAMRPSEFSIEAFVVACFLGIPMGLFASVLAAASRGSSRELVWVVEPTVTLGRELDVPLEEALEVVRTRLASLGFRVTGQGEPATGLAFMKLKAHMVHSFLDHAFKGSIRSSNDSPAQMTVEVTQLDTLIVETGERARLRALAEQILGVPSTAPVKQVPFTLWSAAVATALLVWSNLVEATLAPSTWPTLLPSAAAATFCLGLYSIYLLVRHRSGLEGVGLAIATSAASAVSLSPLFA